MDKGNKKKEIIVPILCILLSIGLWFYVTNIENPMKVIEINKVPVKLVNVDYLKDYNLALAPNQSFSVNLKVEGLGSQVYKLSNNDFNIQIDLQEYALKKGENKIPVTIVSSPSNVNIKNSSSLSITIVLEELSEKKVQIQSDIKVKVKQGFFASKPEINPSEVTVSGPKSLVDSVTSVVASGEEDDVTSDISAQYPLKAVDNNGKEVKGVSLSIGEVKVDIKISKGKSVPVKIKTVGELPSGLKLNTMDATRKSIEIVGSKEALDKITEVYSMPLDLSKITDDKKVSLKIEIPEGVKIAPGEEFVDVNVTVTKTVNKEFEVPVTISGQHEGVTITPKKQTVKVVITGNEEAINKVTVDKFKAVLNVSSYNEDGEFEVSPEVKLEGMDSSISIVSTEKISFTVAKKVNEKPANGEAHQ